MRKLLLILILVLIPLYSLWGAVTFLAADYSRYAVEAETQDLAAVGADLMTPEQLARERARVEREKQRSVAYKRGRYQYAAAGLLIGAALALVVAVVLFGRRRIGRRGLLPLLALADFAAVFALLSGGVSVFGICITVAAGLACALAALMRAPAAAASARAPLA
ncbi:MAG: hypothetical protein H6707_06365 [Deltaproteobacteria bacterium]|nr:hypothetical protein [Deltaproteobacteria bacterium]